MKKIILISLLIINSTVWSQNNSVKIDLPGYKLEVKNYQIESYKNTENLISFEISILRKNSLPLNIINDLKNNSTKLNLLYVSEIFYDSVDNSVKNGIVVYKYKELGKNLILFGSMKKLNSLKNKNSAVFSREFSLVSLLYRYSSADKSLSEKASGKIKKLNENEFRDSKYLDNLLIKDILFVYKFQLNEDQLSATKTYEMLYSKLNSSGFLKIDYFNLFLNSLEQYKKSINTIDITFENAKNYFNEDRFGECRSSCEEYLELIKDLTASISIMENVSYINYMYAFSLYMINKDSPESPDIEKAAGIFSGISNNAKSKYYLKANLALGNIYYLREEWQKAIKCYTTVISTAGPEEEVYKNAFDNLKMISSDK
ncbi:MAG: hypothetical protein JNJ56_05520 [Ignavibacteria bacterium]|nr:hypothetical protein [Ignavibacteria bacterium]